MALKPMETIGQAKALPHQDGTPSEIPSSLEFRIIL